MMGIKWNWGTKLIIAYSGFVIFMLGMVTLCFQQHFDLVTPDYYAQELKFQSVIDGQQNSNRLEKSVLIEQNEAGVSIEFPQELYRIDSGVIKFYRPDNKIHDFEKPLTGGLRYAIASSDFVYGLYKVKFIYSAGGLNYFDEQSLFIKK